MMRQRDLRIAALKKLIQQQEEERQARSLHPTTPPDDIPTTILLTGFPRRDPGFRFYSVS